MRNSNLGQKSLRIIEKAKGIIDQYPGMKLTLRQIYYRLVAGQEIKNSRSSYNYLSSILAQAREKGHINPEAIEDRVRRLEGIVNTWESPKEYEGALKDWTFDMANDYCRDLWASQEKYIEVWTEKDALANIISQATSTYRIPVAICRGYNSLTFLYETVKRIRKRVGDRESIILYFGDFDPSGEDMVRDIRERLSDYFELWGDCTEPPIIRKEALLREDIDIYGLPPDLTKRTDTRAKNFIRKYGDISVELDALPPDELINRVKNSINGLIVNPNEWKEEIKKEKRERKELLASLEEIWSGNL